MQVRAHNEAIWPQVSIAQAAQSELDRTKAFIEHIRSAAWPVLDTCRYLAAVKHCSWHGECHNAPSVYARRCMAKLQSLCLTEKLKQM